jgi:hypothetical protein
MDAYMEAAPGDIIKLLAGRHVVTTHNEKDERCWDNVYRKLVQIVADDGLASDRVLVGILNREARGDAEPCAISVMNADVRIAGMTLLCVSRCARTIFLGVHEAGRLWLEDCSMWLPSSSGERYMMKDADDARDMSPFSKPEFAHGVSVGADSSCFIRGCVIDGAGGAGVQIAPRAARVVVESSTITGCASGSTFAGNWYLSGELARWRLKRGRCCIPTTRTPPPQLRSRSCFASARSWPTLALG